MVTRLKLVLVAGLLVGCGLCGWWLFSPALESGKPALPPVGEHYEPGTSLDNSGFALVMQYLQRWQDPTSLEEIRAAYDRIGYRTIDRLNPILEQPGTSDDERIQTLVAKAQMFMYEGEAPKAYEELLKALPLAEASPSLTRKWLYRIIYFQGIASLRRGEDENCLNCRGEGACIFPLRPTAIHTNPRGSRQAIQHFMEYLHQFPEDLGARWLLNLAHMTLGEHPHKVPPDFLLSFERFGTEADIGRFKDIADLVGVNRFNQAGGAIMDDFDNDGLLDLLVSSFDSAQVLGYYRNKGDGTFEERAAAAGLAGQYGGLVLVQADYNNDGLLDVFIPRGAWYKFPMRPTLLQNQGGGNFKDVTRDAGLMDPVNSNCAVWVDYDNDGFVDLFVANETGPNRLYHNRGTGTFEEVAGRAGLTAHNWFYKGAAWFDYDNDGFPDVFLNALDTTAQLFHNNRDGTFTDVTVAMGIHGPRGGFACWAFDYDNDGWLDLFATCYQHDLNEMVPGMHRRRLPDGQDVTRLYRNVGGKKFQDVSDAMGVNKVFATMGCNFADFDNDGYLDFYLGTGDPFLSTLVPNRMFKNLGGKRFADITATSGTGHLQKGHGVACGDWDRDGDVDLFMVLGGAIPGDRFHNALFQNPGQGNNWLSLKLNGRKSNRAALGARIKIVTGGDRPLTVQRHISSGGSFGANPLQTTIGLGKSLSIATLEITWPTSGTTQVFRDVGVNQAIEITELEQDYRQRTWPRIPAPERPAVQ